MSIGPEHHRALRRETILSTAINGLVPAGIIWFLRLDPPGSLVGEDGIVEPMAKAAGLATLLMTLVLTPIVRARVRSGAVPALHWPQAARGAMRWLPASLPLRALAIAILALVLLVPVGLLVVALLHVLPLSRIGFLIFNLLFGAMVGIVMTRFVVLPALADPVRG